MSLEEHANDAQGSLSLFLLALAALVQLRPDARALTPAQARAMSPAELGDALLAAGHPAVVEAVVGSGIMEAPTPPGQPLVTPVKLFLAARPGELRGFCEKMMVTILLAPTARGAAENVAPARPASLSTSLRYRWADPGRQAPSRCEAPANSFFSPEPSKAERRFKLVRLLAKAREDAVRGRDLPFEIEVVDDLGREMQDFARRHPDQAAHIRPDMMKTFASGRAALAALPIGEIREIQDVFFAGISPLSASDLIDPPGRRREHVGLFLGDWSAGVVLDGDRIVRISLQRAIPPPF
jgi:hypothetical protein